MIQAMTRKSAMPIGVDIGAHAVRLLQFAAGASGLTIVAAASHPLPAGLTLRDERYHEAVAEALQSALSRAGFRGRRVVSALPAAAVGVKSVRMPAMPDRELEQAVRFEAAERMPSDKPRIVQYLKAGEVQQGADTRQEVLLLAADEAFIEAHVLALTTCGLRPLAIDAIPTALARAVTTRADLNPRGGEPAAKVLLDLGHATTNVLVVRGGRVLFYKAVDIGGEALDKAVARQLRLAPADAKAARRAALDPSPPAAEPGGADRPGAAVWEALSPTLAELGKEVALCLRYYGVTFRGARPARGLAVGGLSGSPRLVAELSAAAGLELRVHDPLAAMDPGSAAETIAGDGAAWAVAAGLSLRGGRRQSDGPPLLAPEEVARASREGGRMNTVDFLPPSYVRRQRRKVRTCRQVALVVVVGTLLGFWAVALEASQHGQRKLAEQLESAVAAEADRRDRARPARIHPSRAAAAGGGPP